ncbi:MAG: radical SAM protein [Acidobacteriota bacterium]|nr:radical SAM protein [Acidobacteriota bacterium]
MARVLPIVETEQARTDAPDAPGASNDFDQKLAAHNITLRAVAVETLQVNVGKLCNQACKHCHVDASPTRTEIMTREVAEGVIGVVRRFSIPVLDITGGAPELNPSFRFLVTAARAAGARVMVRHNLTVMFEPGQDDLPEFFRDHKVEVISSLPYFLERETDAQRGRGVFEKSVEALRRLNAVGYGVDEVRQDASAADIPAETRTAPDNSDVVIEETKNAIVETRTFRDEEAAVECLEVRTPPEGETIVKLFLPDGEVRELSGVEDADALEMTGDALLEVEDYNVVRKAKPAPPAEDTPAPADADERGETSAVVSGERLSVSETRAADAGKRAEVFQQPSATVNLADEKSDVE